MGLAVGNITEVTLWGEKMLENINAILICGEPNSGKTTLANYIIHALLEREYKGVIIPFESYVKILAEKCFLWDGEKDEKGKKLLQGLKNIVVEYDENFWVNSVLEELDSYEKVTQKNVSFLVCDDWRFYNEYKVISERFNTYTVKIEPSFLGDKNNLSKVPFFYTYDFVVSNKSTLESLQKDAIEIVNKILGENK